MRPPESAWHILFIGLDSLQKLSWQYLQKLGRAFAHADAMFNEEFHQLIAIYERDWGGSCCMYVVKPFLSERF